MSMTAPAATALSHTGKLAFIRERLAEKPDGVVEALAREAGVRRRATRAVRAIAAGSLPITLRHPD